MTALSPFGFYGSKTGMSGYIANLIDYDTCDTYIEFFGGGAKVLLNKPRHAREIYSEFSQGLCTFFKIMSDPTRAQEFIYNIYQTEYSPREFERAKRHRNEAEDNYYVEYIRQTREIMNRLYKEYDIDKRGFNKAVKDFDFRGIQNILMNQRTFVKGNELLELNSLITKWRKFNGFFYKALKYEAREYARGFKRDEKDSDSVNKMKANTFIETYTHDVVIDALHQVSNHRDNLTAEEEMQLAIDTYIVYAQSRDGMGETWSEVKYNYYYKKMEQLPEIAERMDGVQVTCATAISFLWGSELGYKDNYLDMENVCLYCDPPYLQPRNKDDDTNEDKEDKEEKNLGISYKMSMTQKDHEDFLQRIVDCKCKALVSNYDNETYNKYLTEDNGWHKLEYETVTTVGGKKKDNKRVEVLWVKN